MPKFDLYRPNLQDGARAVYNHSTVDTGFSISGALRTRTEDNPEQGQLYARTTAGVGPLTGYNLNFNDGFTYCVAFKEGQYERDHNGCFFKLSNIWGGGTAIVLEWKLEAWLRDIRLTAIGALNFYNQNIVNNETISQSNWHYLLLSMDFNNGKIDLWRYFNNSWVDNSVSGLSSGTFGANGVDAVGLHHNSDPTNNTSFTLCGPYGNVCYEGWDDLYVDFSVQANRDRFFRSAGIVDPGADGSTAFGRQPLYFSLTGDPTKNVGRVGLTGANTYLSNTMTLDEAPPIA